MNKDRREAIKKLHGQIEDAKNELDNLKGDEEEYLENIPDSMKDGDKGSAAQEAIDNLDSAIASLDEALSSMDEASQ